MGTHSHAVRNTLKALLVSSVMATSVLAAPGGNGVAQSRIDSAQVDPGSQQLMIRGNFRPSGAVVTLDGGPLTCPTYTTVEILCEAPTLAAGTYRLAVGQAIGGPLQADSTIDVTLFGPQSETNVRNFGATGDGNTDDTAAIQDAIAAIADGGTLFFPRGHYRVSDTFVIEKRINVRGEGYGSQIFQAANKTLFLFRKPCSICASPSNMIISDLYLGSAATGAGTSLIELVNGSHNLVQNITMLGSHIGVRLRGALINNFVSLRTGINFGGFFAVGGTSTNQYWVYGERHNNISPNANTFIAPELEGGTNGIYQVGDNGEGSIYVYGGVIEGVTGVGIYLKDHGLPSVISGVHFEANGLSDITLDNAAKVSTTSVLSTQSIDLINGRATTSSNRVQLTSSTSRPMHAARSFAPRK